jgi:hypothetical protein
MTVFKTRESENKELDNNRTDTRDYETFKLNELEDESIFQGEPFLTEIYENEFEDSNTGKTVKKYSANLYIADTETEEKLHIRVNTKGSKDKQQARQGSVLYDIIDSIESLYDPDFEGKNNIHTISFEELREYINGLGFVEGIVNEHIRSRTVWNTFRIVKVKAREGDKDV